MQFLHAPPIHIAALLHLLQPGQLRIRLHHRVDGLAHGLLVDVLEVDLQPFHGLDRQVALGDELALAYGFVGLALALRRLPRQVALALLVALLVQVLHRVEGHRAAADDGQVVARFQLRALVSLVATTEQGEVAAAGYLAAHCRHIGDFVAPGLLATEAAFALLVVEVVTAVVGGQQLQLVAGHQVGFVAGAGLARDQPQVLSGIDRQVAASVHASGLLGDLVVLESDLLGLAIGMLFVGSRDQAHIATRLECHVATSVDAAAHDADIASGADADIAPRHDLGAHLGRLGLVCLASCRPAPLRYRSRNQDIPAALQGEVALAVDDTANIGYIASCRNGQLLRSLDTRGAIGKCLSGTGSPVGGLVLGHRPFIDDVSGKGGEAYLAPGNDAALVIADGAAGQQVEAVAGLDQAAVVDVAGCRAEVVLRAQGTGVPQVPAGDQVHVAPLDQRAVRAQPPLGLGQVDHGGEDLFAIHLDFFQPNDIVGQRRHLGGAEGDARGQSQYVLAGDGVVHQIAEHRFVAVQSGDEALPRTLDDRFAYQALLV
ncbi:hypothetical protein NCGM1179_2879 [Pseudomonas aeruginosa NCMG1179]|nr:hypothetical protein NCGM1179_2879 [Pseudomonas aeruginosa NCMG1179]